MLKFIENLSKKKCNSTKYWNYEWSMKNIFE